MKKLITHAELLAYCKYDPDSGIFTKRKNGMRIGFSDTWNGHRAIVIDGKKYQETRLAVMYVTGKWPEVYIRNNSKHKTLHTKFRHLDFEHKNTFVLDEPIEEVKHIGFIHRLSNAFAGFFGARHV